MTLNMLEHVEIRLPPQPLAHWTCRRTRQCCLWHGVCCNRFSTLALQLCVLGSGLQGSCRSVPPECLSCHSSHVARDACNRYTFSCVTAFFAKEHNIMTAGCRHHFGPKQSYQGYNSCVKLGVLSNAEQRYDVSSCDAANGVQRYKGICLNFKYLGGQTLRGS